MSVETGFLLAGIVIVVGAGGIAGLFTFLLWRDGRAGRLRRDDWHVTPTGGNIFLDLGFTPDEAAALKAESDRRILERLTRETGDTPVGSGPDWPSGSEATI